MLKSKIENSSCVETEIKGIIDNVYIFIVIALDKSVILDVLHSQMKTLNNHVSVSHAYGRSDVNVNQ